MQKCSEHPQYYKTAMTTCPACIRELPGKIERLQADIRSLANDLPFADGQAYYQDRARLWDMNQQLTAFKLELHDAQNRR